MSPPCTNAISSPLGEIPSSANESLKMPTVGRAGSGVCALAAEASAMAKAANERMLRMATGAEFSGRACEQTTSQDERRRRHPKPDDAIGSALYRDPRVSSSLAGSFLLP